MPKKATGWSVLIHKSFETEKYMSTPNFTDVRDDLFLALKYAERDTKYGPSKGLDLGRHFVYDGQFQSAWKRICAGLASADWTKPQSARALYNDPCWESKSFGARIAIGRCLRFFVNHGMLPLQVINPQATGTKLYMPINL
jgi:hypothetical protein